jgi:hypothetical protein
LLRDNFKHKMQHQTFCVCKCVNDREREEESQATGPNNHNGKSY